MERYKSRKFIITLAIVILSTILRYLHLIDAGNWVTINALVINLYLGANIAQKILTKE
jgi:hypothetical protein